MDVFVCAMWRLQIFIAVGNLKIGFWCGIFVLIWNFHIFKRVLLWIFCFSITVIVYFHKNLFNGRGPSPMEILHHALLQSSSLCWENTFLIDCIDACDYCYTLHADAFTTLDKWRWLVWPFQIRRYFWKTTLF